MADENKIGFDISVGKLPLGFDEGPQGLAEAIADRLIIKFSDNDVSFFKSGTEEPSSDQGPWLNTNFDPAQWYVWSPTEGEYVPAGVPQVRLKYIPSVDEPDPDDYDIWIQLDPQGTPLDIRNHNGNRWVGTIEDQMIRKIAITDEAPEEVTLPWAICDGRIVNAITTPDLTDLFVPGAGNSYAVGATGGADSIGNHTHGLPPQTELHTLLSSESGMPDHTHSFSLPKSCNAKGGATGCLLEGGNVGYTTAGSGAQDAAAGHQHDITGPTGGAGAHDNRPNFRAELYVMYVGWDVVEEYANPENL